MKFFPVVTTPPLPHPAGPRGDTPQVPMCAQHGTESTRLGLLLEPTSCPPVWPEPTSRGPQGLHLKQSRRSRLTARSPPQTPGHTRRGPRGGPRAGARASGGGAPFGPVAGVWHHPSTPGPRAPSPISLEVFPRPINHPRNLPKLFTSPPNSQKPRDLPTNRARLPAAWRPRTRPGRRAGPPPRGAARALLRKQASTSMLAQAVYLPLRASP